MDIFSIAKKLIQPHLRILLLAFFGLTFIEFDLKGQGINRKYHNRIEIAAGYTYIPAARTFNENTVWIPNATLEFHHWFYHRFGVVIQAEVEFGDYLVKIEDVEVPRKNRALVLLNLQYELLPRLILVTGLGFDAGRGPDLPVYRAGAFYDIRFNDHWSLTPAAYYDYKFEYDAFVFEVGFGYWFGGNWRETFLNREFKSEKKK
jgi:hypothetical protein